MMKKYDVIIVGAGPGGIFSAYELITNNSDLKVAVFEEGHLLEKRKCPILNWRVFDTNSNDTWAHFFDNRYHV